MKRILFACFLVISFCTLSTERASAQVPHITAAAFTAKVNLLDSYIGAGNMTAATATWDTVHHMMLDVMAYSKQSMRLAAPADVASFATINTGQMNLYHTIVPLRFDLAGNRTTLHTKLGEFDATIY